MAVLHHAFRCPMTPDLEREISDLVATWERGDRDGLSAMALAGYEALGARDDIHAAFSLSAEGPVKSWLQPEHISPGLAALLLLAQHFVGVPGLSRSHDSNHHLLETQLPLLGWSAADVALLVRGHPIEAMLEYHVPTISRPAAGGFAHTGGWTTPGMAAALRQRFEQLTARLPVPADDKDADALHKINEYRALDDARAMLVEIKENDWLVMAITH